MRLMLTADLNELLDKLDHALVAVAGVGALEEMYSAVARKRWWRTVGNVSVLSPEEFGLRKALDLCLTPVRQPADLSTAWHNLFEAQYWYGLAIGSGVTVQKRRMTSQAAADESHRDDRAMHADVDYWLRKNRNQFVLQIDAIKALVGSKLVPVKRSTLKTWVIEFDKAQRKAK